jgi:hypothetical protein
MYTGPIFGRIYECKDHGEGGEYMSRMYGQNIWGMNMGRKYGQNIWRAGIGKGNICGREI